MRARQLACCGPDGTVERAGLAAQMLDIAAQPGSAPVEMWARLWRIDTLFESGRLAGVQRELADLGHCLERVQGPLGRWHALEYAATLAVATGRYDDAVRLGGEAFRLISAMGHPLAFGTYAVILGQVGLHL